MRVRLRRGLILVFAINNCKMFYAIAAALLFGASTPFAKILLGEISPILLAGLFYFGSALGLGFIFLVKEFWSKEYRGSKKILAKDIPYLIGAVVIGGIAAPVILMIGISLIPSSSASLLLNSEVVLTALTSWFVFKEKFDWHVMIGMLFTILANILTIGQLELVVGAPWGGVMIVLACLCWAIDNNLIRKISANDVLVISTIKVGVAGSINLLIALLIGSRLPDIFKLLQVLIIGFLGYGLSLVFFVLALRKMTTARVGAYFSIAPFCGAALSLLILQENPSLLFFVAAFLMMIGVMILSCKTN